MSIFQPDPVLVRPPRRPKPTLLFLTLHPPPPVLVSFYICFRSILISNLSALNISRSHYILYAPPELHCTLATLHPWRTKPRSTSTYLSIVSRASARRSFPPPGSAPTLLLRGARIFQDGVGALLFRDERGAVSAMRDCVRDEISSDPHMRHVRLPGMVHVTVLRWRHAPRVDNLEVLQNAFDDAFERAGGAVQVPLQDIRIVREDLAYMRESTVVQVVRKFRSRKEGEERGNDGRGHRSGSEKCLP